MKQSAVRPRARRPFSRALAALALVLSAGCGDGGTGGSEHPTPGILAISPTQGDVGAPGTAILVTGSDFVRQSVVRFNGADRATEYVSSTELRAHLTPADLQAEGTAQVHVFTPPPGGGLSNAVPFVVGVTVAPVPTLASISPTFVAAGSNGATVTLTGTGFVPRSEVLSGPIARLTTYVSPTQLRLTLSAAEVAAAGTLVLRVFNPGPGGGASSPTNFEIRSPVPAITSLAQTQATAGQQSYVLRVNGTGFVGNSEVRFNGSARATRLVTPGQLEATLGDADLRAAGTFAITVSNPGPGGGTSNAVQFQLVNGVPQITQLPSQGAAAGRPGFSLMLHGSGFVAGSVVRWNGADLPTQLVSSTRLSADVPVGLVAAPGTVLITVANPAPGGGASPAAPLVVRAVPGDAVTASHVVGLPARDVVYSAHTGRLYATIAGSAAQHANSVVAIDPATGAVTGAVFVGSEPAALAISSDGQVLWVGLDGSNSVRRVEAASLTPGVQFSLNGLDAEEIEVMPGSPGTVAIALADYCCSPKHQGVAVYDDGTRRAGATPGHTGSNSIEFGSDGSELYGYNNESTDFGFRRMNVTGAGVAITGVHGGLIQSFYTRITFAGGRVYARTGEVVDAARMVRVGVMGGGTSFTRITATAAPGLGRAFFLDEAGRVDVFDLNNFTTLGAVSVGPFGTAHPALRRTRLVLWGSDGLAFVANDGIHIVRTPIAGG